MSISSEISRISQNVSDSLNAVAAKGVAVPAGSTSDDLPTLIAQISSGSEAKTISLTSDDDTWAKIWEKIDTIDVRESVPFYSHTTPTGILSNNTRSNALIGVICKTATDGTFDIISRFGINNGIVLCRIEGASSASAGTYSERVIDDTYDDCGTVATQADLFSLFDTTLSAMSNYRTTQIHVSATAAIPPFLSGARLMITLVRGASATYAAAIIQQAGADVIATAGKSTTWTMHELVRQSVIKQQEFTVTHGNGTKVVKSDAGMTVYMFISFYNHVETWAGMWTVMFGSASSNPSIKTIYSSSKISVAATAARQVTFSNSDATYDGHISAIRLAGAGELTIT